MQQVDVYWSFRSPYSYLATPGLLEIRDNYQVEVNLRVVLPIAVRAPELLFNPQNANRTRYILKPALVQDLDKEQFSQDEFEHFSFAWQAVDTLVRDRLTLAKHPLTPLKLSPSEGRQ